MKASVVYASGSDDTRKLSPRDVALISEAIKERGINVVDVIKALAKRGFREEAENLLNVVKLRVSGDYLQTSAMVRNGRIVSAVNDPNDYLGPGTGYRVSEARRQRDQRHPRRARPEDRAAPEASCTSRTRRSTSATATSGRRSRASAERRGGDRHQPGLRAEALPHDSAAIRLSEVLGAMIDGDPRARRQGARRAHAPHRRHLVPRAFAPRGLPARGIGIGIQAKGTAVIHQRDRLPHNNLELFSNAPITRLEHYRALGANAAAYALGEMPEPVVVPTRGEAMGSRYHARVALIYAIETSLTEDGAAPEEVEVTLTGAAVMSAQLRVADYPLAETRPEPSRGGAASRSPRSRSMPCSPAT